MTVSGQYDYDFRIAIATREGSVCILRRGWLEGKPLFHMDRPVIGLSLLTVDQANLIVCADQSLDCYTKKGKRLWGVNLSESAICMETITLTHVGQTLICVALRGGLVQIYLNKVVVDHFNVAETVAAMKFGRLGQEDHVLVLITIGNFFFFDSSQILRILHFLMLKISYGKIEGSLVIKILKRTAEFMVETIDFNDRSHERSGSLQIPKKTKVFIEQTIRERENAPGTCHFSFIPHDNKSFIFCVFLTSFRSNLQQFPDGTVATEVGSSS